MPRRGATKRALGMVVATALTGQAKAQVLEMTSDGALTRVEAQAPSMPAVCGKSRSSTERLIAEAATRYRLSPALVEAVARQESGLRQQAVSPKGAVGVMQLMPATAKALGVDASDLWANVMGGAAYLRGLIDRFDGDLERAIAAYNAGPGAVDRYGGPPPYQETQAYLAANLERLAQASAQPHPCLEGDAR